MIFNRNFFFNIYSRIFSKPFFYRFNKLLFNLSIRGLGIYSHNTGESYFYLKLLPKIIKNQQPVIFDVGAYLGENALQLHKILPESRIFSFEPNPRCFERLKNVESNNIMIFNCALGDKTKKIKLFEKNILKITKHSSLYKEVISDLHRSELSQYEIDMITLDEVCEINNIKYIDFLKIDTEGNELNVLKGGKSLIKDNSIRCIQFEFNTMNVISRVFFRDFIKLLENYRFYRMLPGGLIKLNKKVLYTEIYGLQNIVAISKN
jgi:FkbM family methyltransferase